MCRVSTAPYDRHGGCGATKTAPGGCPRLRSVRHHVGQGRREAASSDSAGNDSNGATRGMWGQRVTAAVTHHTVKTTTTWRRHGNFDERVGGTCSAIANDQLCALHISVCGERCVVLEYILIKVGYT